MKKFLLLLLLVPILAGINTLSEGYRVLKNGGSTRLYIDDGTTQGICYNIQNNNVTSDLFVPTKTLTEWNSFLTNTPGFVTKTLCQPKSCLEIKNLIGDPIPVYCDMTSDGGGWTRVFYHTVSGSLFVNNAEALSTNQTKPLTTSKYSILNRVVGFLRSGQYEMKMDWPASGSSKRNWWTQTSNFVSTTITGYASVSVQATANGWGGLEPNVDGVSLADGTVGGGGWYYAIGSQVLWGTTNPGIPASDDVVGVDTGAPRVQLWIK